MNKLKIAYDPTAKVSYGSWFCEECKSHFFGGGPAIHDGSCSLRSEEYDGLVYLYSPHEKAMLDKGETNLLMPGALLKEYWQQRGPWSRMGLKFWICHNVVRGFRDTRTCGRSTVVNSGVILCDRWKLFLNTVYSRGYTSHQVAWERV